MKIRQQGPEPIHTQLREIMLRAISEGKFRPGERIPSERELAQEYKISRTSVRETITGLINAGVLFRAPGKGTFVSEESRQQDAPGVQTIGFVISEDIFNFVQTGYNKILAGAQQVCSERNTRLVFHSAGDDFGAPWFKGNSDTKRHLSGCIVVGGVRRHIIEQLQEASIPTVLVDIIVSYDLPELPSITIDYEGGARLAIKHLYSEGYRTIGYIGFPGSQKYSGYWQSLEDIGLTYDPRQVEFLQLLDLQPGILAGYQAMLRMIGRKRLPSALLVTNDFVAIGVMEALAVSGIRVPDQIAIVGFDDLGLKTTPALTTIRVDLRRVGEEAAVSLFRTVRDGNSAPQTTVIPVDLVVRGSTSSNGAAAMPIQAADMSTSK